MDDPWWQRLMAKKEKYDFNEILDDDYMRRRFYKQCRYFKIYYAQSILQNLSGYQIMNLVHHGNPDDNDDQRCE
jgi:hypothetical protein